MGVLFFDKAPKLNRYSVPSGSRRDLHNEAEGRVTPHFVECFYAQVKLSYSLWQPSTAIIKYIYINICIYVYIILDTTCSLNMCAYFFQNFPNFS